MTNNRLIDHVKIEELLKATTLTPIMSIIRSKVLNLFGNIKRAESGLSKLCLEGKVEGKRNRGRQPKRWCGNIYDWSQLDLTDLNAAIAIFGK